MNETDRLLSLVRLALDEFESSALAASLRRALRIAQLKGDAVDAWLFRKDLRPMGGSGTVLKMEIQSLWPDMDSDSLQRTDRALLEEWMKERQIVALTEDAKAKDTGEGLILVGSVEEMETELGLREGVWREELPDLKYRAQMDLSAQNYRSVLARIRARTFAYLCRCETSLALGGASATIFDKHRRRVDATLTEVAPAVLDQFSAAYRRAAEGDGEALAHALTSCRRIMKAVADVVFPATNEDFIGSDGTPRKVGDEQYKNRLIAFLQISQGRTASQVVLASLEDLGNRIGALYELDSKGVHASPSQAEVDLCVVQTYLLAGEVLALHEGR